jgi:non-homologous end joining protein Ku
VEVSRSEPAKGYEYEPGRYFVLSRQEIESITPRTAPQMQILEFVKLAEVDPVYLRRPTMWHRIVPACGPIVCFLKRCGPAGS